MSSVGVAAAAAAVADAHRHEWAFVLAATVRVTRDIDLAEECVQADYAQALTSWADGIPARPGAWLTTVARRRALDLLRRESVLRRFQERSSFAQGRRVRVEEDGGYEGLTAGLDARGFLQVETVKGLRTVLSGGVRGMD